MIIWRILANDPISTGLFYLVVALGGGGGGGGGGGRLSTPFIKFDTDILEHLNLEG